MELRTDEEIANFAEQIRSTVAEKQLPYLIVEIKHLSNLFLFVEEGFLPIFNKEKEVRFGYDRLSIEEAFIKYLVAVIVEDYSIDEINFWFGQEFRAELDNFLTNGGQWVYGTIKYYKDKSLKDGRSYTLVLYAKDLVYQSNRPRTDMSMFRTPTSKRQTSEDKNYIPVTRYASTKSSGLYFKQEDNSESFCGTFYYMEPESRTFLEYKTSLTFRNKYECIKELLKRFDSSEYKAVRRMLKYFEKKDETDLFIKMNEEFPDLMLTPYEIFETIDWLYSNGYNNFFNERDRGTELWNPDEFGYAPDVENFEPEEDVINIYGMERKRYAGLFLGLYALEDRFDQPICAFASQLGIDIVIFTDMIGSHQMVTEILDTRDRKNSFDNLVFVD